MGNLTLHAEGNPVCSFINSAATPIDSLKVYFTPRQEDGGDPSPTNIRPIIGWTSLTVYIGSTVQQADATIYPVDWTNDAGTIYGGYINLVTGVLTKTYDCVNLGDYDWNKIDINTYTDYKNTYFYAVT